MRTAFFQLTLSIYLQIIKDSMKAKTPPIKNATIFSSSIDDKKEMIIIIKDTAPENILTTKDSKKDIFILRYLATKQISIIDKSNPNIKDIIIPLIYIFNCPTGVFTVDIPPATTYTINIKIISNMIATIDITRATLQLTLNAVLQIYKTATNSKINPINPIIKKIHQ